FRILFCKASPEEMQRRILTRTDDPSDATIAVLQQQILTAQMLADDELPSVVYPGEYHWAASLGYCLPAATACMIRNIVHYSGQVQGVGFRMRVQRLALGVRVTGYVMNLPDGRVRLVAEGDAAEVRGLIAAVGKELAEYIAR